MRWTVEMTDEAEQQMISDMKTGRLSRDDIIIIKKWVAEIEGKGLKETQVHSAWRDHELSGKWDGCRAISFSYVGRLIYKVENEKIIVRVVRVTPDHDYT